MIRSNPYNFELSDPNSFPMTSERSRNDAGAPATLFIRLDRSHPLGEQLGRRIRNFIREKRLLPGTRLPSLRVMAKELGISVDTVLDVYRLLSDEGWLRSRRGAGFFVSDDPNVAAERNEVDTAAPDASRSTSSRRPSHNLLDKTARVREQLVPEQRTFTKAPLTTYASGMNCIAEKHFLRFAAQLARSPWLHPRTAIRRAICRCGTQYAGDCSKVRGSKFAPNRWS